MTETIPVWIAALIGTGLLTALGVLWRKLMKLEKTIEAMNRARLQSEIDRGLARLEDERRHSTEIRELAAQVLVSVHESTSASRETAIAMHQLAKGIAAQTDILRKCRASGQHTVPQPQTAQSDAETALLPKDRHA